MKNLFEETIAEIKDYGNEGFEACKALWNQVAKPLNSLGELESLTSQIANVQGTGSPCIAKRRVLVFCADNGVVEEGVSQSDHTVTTAVARSLGKGMSNVNLMAQAAHAEVRAYDVGMKDDLPADCGLIIDKTANGSQNFTKGPAMSREGAIHALEVGIRAAQTAKEEGCDILLVGEMGIGNTTSSSAILSVLLGLEPEKVTGRGSGLSDDGMLRKLQAIKKCREVNQPDPNDALDVLIKAGGFDIAAMAGVFLGAARQRIPVLMDGLISNVAALVACRIEAKTRQVVLPSHSSRESGGAKVLEELGMHAVIQADMALGEGTGAVAMLPLLDLALAVFYGDHKFSDINIEAYTPQE